LSLPLLDPAGMERVLRRARRVGVLGIRPGSRRDKGAFYIPAYLAEVGYEIVPVPTHPTEETAILGFAVRATLRDAGDLDILSVFRRPEQVPAHLADILAVRPGVVWFQSGLLHLPSAEALVAAGIEVAHDCIGCRRAEIAPAWSPLEGQRRG
jgi:predicted CoA-binding protein